MDLSSLEHDYQSARQGSLTRQVWNRSVEAYFHQLSGDYLNDFWASLMEEQELLIAMGSSYLDPQHLRSAPFSSTVSVYLNINESWGHVASGSALGLEVRSASIDKSVIGYQKSLHSAFGVAKASAVHPTVKSFSHFVAKARRYFQNNLIDEAFVHYVIALELLFSERKNTTDVISRRVAMVAHRPLGLSLDAARKAVSALYEVRSRYVHEGTSVEVSMIPRVATMCEHVPHAVLRRHKLSSGSDFHEQWLKEIDYLYASLDASKEVEDSDFRSAGIIG